MKKITLEEFWDSEKLIAIHVKKVAMPPRSLGKEVVA